MSSIPKSQYLLPGTPYYEPLARYVPPDGGYLDLVKSLLPPQWNRRRDNLWYQFAPPEISLPPQGWKVHLSATTANASEILTRSVPVLAAAGLTFKVVVDSQLLAMVLSKRWPRAASAKFVTAYPAGEREFLDVLESLHQATIGLEGPQILSDRRYRESKVVHYRYGGIAPLRTVAPNGEKRMLILDPAGQPVLDERQPRFRIPEWVTDPVVTGDRGVENPEVSPGGARFQVRSTLALSNGGKVSLALDSRTDATVVLKEARRWLNVSPSGLDAVARLESEYRLLQRVEPAGIAPRPLDFIVEEDRACLVQEYLAGMSPLRSLARAQTLLLWTSPTRQQVQAFCTRFAAIFQSVARLLAAVHQHGIVFMDFTDNNVLFSPGFEICKLVDFELAFERGAAVRVDMMTPGFISAGDLNGDPPGFESDYYSLGALMLACLIPVSTMSVLDPDAPTRFLRELSTDYGLPGGLSDLILALMHPRPELRPSPVEVMRTLEAGATCTVPGCHPSETRGSTANQLARIVKHILSSADYSRTDRLFPADPKVFATGPLNVAYGACGVAHALRCVTGSVPQQVTGWITSREVSPEAYPPGLYLGTSGIAWVLRDLGFPERAAELMRGGRQHPAILESPDLLYGLAGRGIALMKFFRETGDEEYLRDARWVAERILSMAKEESGRLSWPDPRGSVTIGLAHGASGISIFFLYLFLLTGDNCYFDAGSKAVEFDLAAATYSPDRSLTWPLRPAAGAPGVPYMRYGTAGVGMAVARYYRATGEARYRSLLENMLPDVGRKYAISPGRFLGLAGMGDFLLDCRDVARLGSACDPGLERILAGLQLYLVETPDGLAAPGYELHRLSCDYATGSAGVALFLHRYLHFSEADFLLDGLFVSSAREVSPAAPYGGLAKALAV